MKISHDKLTENLIHEAAGAFLAAGDFASARRLSIGHIHDTFVVTRQAGSGSRRYLLQRINSHVFPSPVAMMINISRVTEHIRDRLQQEGRVEEALRVLSVIPAADGHACWQDGEGGWWRTYSYVENTRVYDRVESPEMGYRGARAFGDFVRLLANLPGPRLEVTIPHFHDTPARFDALVRAVEADPGGRAGQARDAIVFALERQPLAGALADEGRTLDLPERVAHNDTKFNNVLFDRDSGEAVCVVDLDTVMPGLVLHDFGDLVRTTVSTAAEAERDPEKTDLRLPVFEAVARGYLAGAGGILTDHELRLMAVAPRVIALELGLRFLCDYLEGDRYFRAAYPEHNLDRARTQLRLLERMENQADAMSVILERILAER